MPTLYFLYAICLIFAYLSYYFAMNYIRYKRKYLIEIQRRNDTLTSFEKLEYMIELYRSIDFEKLRPDQLDNWNEFIINETTKTLQNGNK